MELKFSFYAYQSQAGAGICAYRTGNRAKMRGPKHVIPLLSTKQLEKTVHLCAVSRMMREKYQTNPSPLPDERLFERNKFSKRPRFRKG
jgi:hypothetical protein